MPSRSFNILLFFLFFQFPNFGLYQAHAQELQVDCGGVLDLCGYIDNISKQEVIPKEFERARRFFYGKAAVRIEGKWGFINRNGVIVIPPQYDEVGNFVKNRAEIIIDGKSGIINESSDTIIQPQFSRAIPFTDDVVIAVPLSNSVEQQRPRVGTNLSLITLGQGAGLFHRAKGWISEKNLQFRVFGNHGIGLIWAGQRGKRKFGLLAETGEFKIAPKFDHVQPLREDRALVSIKDHQNKSKWGAVNGKGEIAIPLAHDWLSFFENGYGLVGLNTDKKPEFKHRKLGLINPNGKILGDRYFDKAARPRDGVPPQVSLDGIWYNLNADGSLTRKEIDGKVIAKCPQGLTIIRKGRGFEILGSQGEKTLNKNPDRVSFSTKNYIYGQGSNNADRPKELDCDAPISIGVGSLQNMSWGFVKPDGTKLYEPDAFASVFKFAGGYTVVGTGERWGVIDANGNFTIPLNKDAIAPLADSENLEGGPFFWFRDGDNVVYMDAQGEQVSNPTKQKEQDVSQVLECRNGARVFSADDGRSWGIKGPNDEVIIPSAHRAISCFKGGVAYVPNDEKQKWCPIGPDGKYRDAPMCIDTYYPYFVTHHFPEKLAESHYDNSILWVRAFYEYGIGARDKAPTWVSDGVRGNASYSVLPNR